MSKKKAFGGNTMTLKDFHGGSIPTDLPLPSAPGVTVRSTDWSGYDRSNSWGGTMGRADFRSRPNSSPATRHFDDKSPFLSHKMSIGRNFDEDERNPLDGVSAPRRTVSDSFLGAPSRMEPNPATALVGRVSRISDESFVAPSKIEPKLEPALGGRVSSGALVSQSVNSYSKRVSEGAYSRLSSQNVGGNSGQSVGSVYPNAWAAKKELTLGSNEPVQSQWSGGNATSKLAHASALEKVSSGRWQTNHSIHYQTNAEVIEHVDMEKALGSKIYDNYAYNRTDVAGRREYCDATLARHVERGLDIEDGIQDVRKEVVDHNRIRVHSYSESKDRNPRIHDDKVELLHADGKFGWSETQPPAQSEASDWSKVMVLPRTKPLESLETTVVDHKQGSQCLNVSVHGHVGISNGFHGNSNAAKPGLVGIKADYLVVERPKLNLKPRSQNLDQSEGNSERERVTVFGGARPREVVLKERGINDAPVSNHDLDQHSDRIKHSFPKIEKVPEHAIPIHQQEKAVMRPMEQGIGKKSGQKERLINIERVDMPGRNRRNENWRNRRETERRQQQQLQQERQPSPESWRKPIEQPKPAFPDAVGRRYGKTASALELAQAFSRSFSEPKTADRYSAQGGLYIRTEIPFSRLMAPTPRPQINGY